MQRIVFHTYTHPPQNGTTPLYMASQLNHLDIIALLLAAGAKVNLGDEVRNQLVMKL